MNQTNTYIITAQKPVTKRQNPVNHTIVLVCSATSDFEARNMVQAQFGDQITGIRKIQFVGSDEVACVRR